MDIELNKQNHKLHEAAMTYWAGAFDEKTTQGVKVKPKIPVSRGTKAWVFEIEKNTGQYTIYTRKDDRNKKFKVRPIRLVFEDTLNIPTEGSEEYKLWRLQPLK